MSSVSRPALGHAYIAEHHISDLPLVRRERCIEWLKCRRQTLRALRTLLSNLAYDSVPSLAFMVPIFVLPSEYAVMLVRCIDIGQCKRLRTGTALIAQLGV